MTFRIIFLTQNNKKLFKTKISSYFEGLEDAIKAGVKEIAVFTTASETFCKKNVNCSIAESLQRIEEVIDEALKRDIKVRGYVQHSCIPFPLIVEF
jgi:isopropylmalate/homocitrate/citramalate synthase